MPANDILMGFIRSKFKTQKQFAEALLISSVSLSNKLSGKSEWKISEIRKSIEILGIPRDRVSEFFNLW